ncbi:hypothetical protein ACFPRL_31165 [Pseudoclavibacter helvolus]
MKHSPRAGLPIDKVGKTPLICTVSANTHSRALPARDASAH